MATPKQQEEIGVAMIVRNASEHLGRALDSISSFAKQIVVVDTGSNDNTPKIAVAYGAEVHFHAWNDDFSQSRNYALQAMRTEWILQLDADEEVENGNFRSVHDSISQTSIGGATVKIINILPDGTKSTHHFTRLFRKHRSIRYAGRIHEQIAPSIIALGYDIAESQIVITHHGYASEKRERALRNRWLLEKELLDNPNDIWLQYHLGMSLFAEKNYKETAEILTKIGNSTVLSQEQRELSKIRAAQALIALEFYDKALNIIDFRSNSPEHEGLRLYVLGLLFGLRGDLSQAVSTLLRPEIKNSDLVNRSDADRFAAQFASVMKRGKSSLQPYSQATNQ